MPSVRKDDATKSGTIDGSVGVEDIITKIATDKPVGRLARFYYFSCDFVSIDDSGSSGRPNR